MADVNNPIKYSDLIVPDESVTKLISQLEQLTDVYNKLASNIKAQASTLEGALHGVSGATEEGRAAIGDASKEAQRLAAAYKEVQSAGNSTTDTLIKLKTAQSEQAQLVKLAVDMNKQNEGSYKALVGAIDDATAKTEALKRAQKEQNAIAKYTAQMNASAKGSYNALAAEYNLLKTRLNALSEEQRFNTEEGKKMEQRAAEVYERMKQLQEATGKYTLNVGNYESGVKSLRMELREITQQMAEMQMAGQGNSEEYAELAAKAGEMRDAMNDANQAITRMASDTSQLDTVMSGLTAASGGFTALTGAMNLFGESNENVAEAQKQLQSVMAITMGLTQLQNALQKQSALMLGISTLQTKALAKAEAYEKVIKEGGTKATIGATIAQKAFNVVAKANPYVLLAMALITVVGALLAFSKGSKEAEERQKYLNEQEKRAIDIHLQLIAIMKVERDEREKDAANAVALAKARGDSIENVRKAEDNLARVRRENHQKDMQENSEYLRNENANREAVKQTLLLIEELNKRKKGSKVTLTIDGEKSKYNLEDGIQALQEWVERKQKQIDIAVNVRQQGRDLDAEERQREAERQKEDFERYKSAKQAENNALREAEAAKIDMMNDSYAKQVAQAKANTAKEIADLRWRLQYEKELTSRARQAINDLIKTKQEQLNRDLLEMSRKHEQEIVEAERTTNDARIALMDDSREKDLQASRAEYERRRDELMRQMSEESKLSVEQKMEAANQLRILDEQQRQNESDIQAKWDGIALKSLQEATQLRIDSMREGSEEQFNEQMKLLELQRQEELLNNSQAIEAERQSELDINAKYDRLALQQRGKFLKEGLDQYVSMMESEIDALNVGETKKERLALQLEKQRLAKTIALIENGMMDATAAELATYKNQYAKVSNEVNMLTKIATHQSSVEDIKEGMQESAANTLEVLSTITEARVKMAEAAVTAADKEVESAQKALDAQREAAAEGYASNQELAQKELEAAKENQRKALAQQRKAQKQQQVIDTLTQISSLVTASANMWKDLGFPMAIAGIATMWASFAASKIVAARMSKQATEEYGEGTVELLQGGSHQSGNDIDLGTKPDGTRRRAEGGEFFAVINKRNSRRYRKQIPAIINALNDGTFDKKFATAYGTDKDGIGIAVTGTTDVSTIESEVRRIREQGEMQTYVDGNGNLVTRYKNLTQHIKRS